MGRVSACGDNAAMESFFALLQLPRPDPHTTSQRTRGSPKIPALRQALRGRFNEHHAMLIGHSPP